MNSPNQPLEAFEAVVMEKLADLGGNAPWILEPITAAATKYGDDRAREALREVQNGNVITWSDAEFGKWVREYVPMRLAQLTQGTNHNEH